MLVGGFGIWGAWTMTWSVVVVVAVVVVVVQFLRGDHVQYLAV